MKPRLRPLPVVPRARIKPRLDRSHGFKLSLGFLATALVAWGMSGGCK